LDALDRKILQLEIELEAMKREEDTKKMAFLKQELASLNEERTALHGRWSAEKERIDKVQKIKAAIESHDPLTLIYASNPAHHHFAASTH
jgi:ATP-dependent Clp protease ATP-binding subunit ClpB